MKNNPLSKLELTLVAIIVILSLTSVLLFAGWWFLIPSSSVEDIASNQPSSAPEVDTMTNKATSTPLSQATAILSEEIPPNSASSEIGYELNWKIEENQPIAYNTAMEVSDCCTEVDYDRIFNFGQFDEGEDTTPHFEEMFEDLQNNQPSYSIVSILEKKPDGNISVKMVLDNVEMPEQETEASMGQWYAQMLQGMEGSVQMQGDITPEGEIASPYVAQQQKNLLALFFELPVGAVKVGDTWQIDLTCITLNSAQFKIDNSDQVNQVTLREITETSEGEPVAILDYLIAESVEGEQTIPFFSNEPVPTTMKCSFVGRGEFLIEQGKWQAFSAENTVETTGVVTSNVTQQLALTPLDEVPEYPEPDTQNQPSLSEILSKPQETKVCWYKSEEVIGENAKGEMAINSYLPADEELWTTARSVVLQLANIEPPAELLLNGEKFIRNPMEKMIGEQPSLPIDSSQVSEPIISLILTSNEKEIEDPVMLSFEGQDYLLALDDGEMNEYCQNEGSEFTEDDFQTQTAKVVVALKPIGRGTIISDDLVGYQDWPVNNMPLDTVFDKAETIGRVSKTEIIQGQLIVHSMFE